MTTDITAALLDEAQKHVGRGDDCGRLARLVVEALASAPGWQLVPKQWTSEMAHAGYMVHQNSTIACAECGDIYRAMLDAAPEPQPCQYCDGTGDVHGIDGEWRGVCTCAAGKAKAESQPSKVCTEREKCSPDAKSDTISSGPYSLTTKCRLCGKIIRSDWD